MKNICTSLLLGLVLFLTSCAGTQWNKGQEGAVIGAVGGAAIGQAVGRNTEATLIGTMVGTMIGYMVGNEMDKYDRQHLNRVYETNRTGQTSRWRNPDSGNEYSVTPYSARQGIDGPCRDAQVEAIIDGQLQTTHTRACRDYNGQWILQ